MDNFVTFIPLALIIALYWWGFRKFKSKHGQEVSGPQGQTPYGVHGLLAFFIFASYYIAPLFAMGSVNSNFMKAEAQYPNLLSLPGYGTYKTSTFIMALGVIIWQIMVAHKLRWKLEPSSLKSARTLCIAAPVIFIIGDVILGNVTMDVVPNAETMLSYIGSLLMSSIWAAYFFFSKRCRNTYSPTQNKYDFPDKKSVNSDATPEKEHVNFQRDDIAQRLIKLQELKSAGLLSKEEYEAKRSEILNSV